MSKSPEGRVEKILIAPTRGAPMKSVTRIAATAGEGLEGDRYAEPIRGKSPDYECTLIEAENIEGFARATGLAFTPEMARRNLVTRGVRLNELVGKRFRIADAVFEGMELCEPCSLLAKRTHREVLRHLANKGGLRARIVTTGMVHVGDAIAVTRRAVAAAEGSS